MRYSGALFFFNLKYDGAGLLKLNSKNLSCPAVPESVFYGPNLLSFHQGLNFEEDWKLLTILMGMNDICDYCKDKVCLFLLEINNVL